MVRALMRFNMQLIRWGSHLQKRTEHYSSSRKKFFLLLFCFAFVSASTLVIFTSLQNANEDAFAVTPVRYVAPVTGAMKEAREYPGVVERRIEDFNHYLDHHKCLRDSLLHARPRLIDTLNYLNKIYKDNENGK